MNMEKSGIISKVEGPTESWLEQSKSVRICVDLKPLNESVLRENYPLPKIDETLAQLSGTSIFSKLEANSGFWQISLAKDCRLLTTFLSVATSLTNCPSGFPQHQSYSKEK